MNTVCHDATDRAGRGISVMSRSLAMKGLIKTLMSVRGHNVEFGARHYDFGDIAERSIRK